MGIDALDVESIQKVMCGGRSVKGKKSSRTREFRHLRQEATGR